jgi:hypothetical protein
MTQRIQREKKSNGLSNDVGFYPKRQRNIKRGKNGISNRVENLMDEVEIIKIAHLTEEDEKNENETERSEGGWMEGNDERLKIK